MWWNLSRNPGKVIVFTGIIEALGTVVRLTRVSAGGVLAVRQAGLNDVALGESIAVNGVCLTVASIEGETWTADLAPETLRRTTLGSLRVSESVHIERALRVGDRLSGHFVQGHVDEVGHVSAVNMVGNDRTLDVDVSAENCYLLVEKGSVAIDGVSLTVAAVRGRGFRVALVPYTLEHTTFRALRVGSGVNVEFDVLAKYVARLTRGERPVDEAFLGEHGYL